MAFGDLSLRLEDEPAWIDERCATMIAARCRDDFGARVRVQCALTRPAGALPSVPVRALGLVSACDGPLTAPRELWARGTRSPWRLAAEYVVAFRDAADSLGPDAALVGVSCAGVFLLVNRIAPRAAPWSFGKLALNLHRWPPETLAAWLHQ